MTEGPGGGNIRAYQRVVMTFLIGLLGAHAIGWLPTAAWGQGALTYASLTGTVVDETEGVLPGTRVTVTNGATGFTREAITDSDGHFSVLELPPGNYTAVVELDNFQTALIDRIELVVGSTRTLRLTLTVGQVTQTVEVSSEPVAVETTRSDVSGVIRTQQLQDLPLNQRSFTALVPGRSRHH